MNDKGFILITILFLLLLVAVTATSLNVKSGLQSKMTANQSADAQTYFGQLAMMERAVWELTRNPWWRTNSLQTYHEEKFNLRADVSGVYNDAVIISVDKSGYDSAMSTSLRSIRYYLSATEYTGFNQPRHIALDTAGNVYIADTGNHCIRKVDTAGTISTVAGTGTSGYNGDGILATNARLNNPAGVAVDDSGNIFIADTYNCCIRKVDAVTNIISRVAGKAPAIGSCGYNTDNSPLSAKLNYPYGVKVKNGNLYIADYDNQRVRKVDITAGTIVTVAGNGMAGYWGDNDSATSARLYNPVDIFVDDAENLFIADLNNHCVRKVDAATQIISTFAGSCTNPGYSGDGGPAAAARLDAPRGLFKDAVGNLYIADRDQHVVRVVSGQNGYIYTLAGTGSAGYNWTGVPQPAGEFQLNSPSSIALPQAQGGRVIYISDRDNNRIRVLTLTFKLEKQLYK